VESNIHKWDNFFRSNKRFDKKPFVLSMDLGSKFLEDCKTVEDWGCGDGIFKFYRDDAIGVDGSDTPGANKKFIDLTDYITDCEGIFLKHVLEHNYGWKRIVHNMLTSFSKKICIVMFIPFGETEKTIEQNYEHSWKVPNLIISKKEFKEILDQYKIEYEFEKIVTGEEIVYIKKL
jgi:hypothetical protein